MTNKYSLGICELFNPYLHGYTSKSSPTINSHYLIHSEIELADFFDLSYEENVENLLEYYYNFFHYRRLTVISHPIIRNYHHIIDNVDIIKLDIIEIIELPGLEQVACIKTFWLKILQRKWKRIYKERKIKMQKLKKLHILRKREITGKI